MNPSQLATWHRAPGVLLCLALVVAGLGTTDAGAQVSSDCPVIMPTADVRAGMVGTGVTVAKGRQRENFNVEVLGVIQDAFPGRDLIVVDTSGGPIDQYGGIWYGMSGSPVYIDGKLIGAVAFGLSFGPSTVGALTPAEEMIRVVGYPTADEGSASTATPTRAEPSGPMAARIAARTGQSNPGSFEQLRVPVGVSGGSYRLLNKLSNVIEREGLPIIPFAGSSASLSQTSVPATAVQPGDNLVAALSYGDITFAGLGTATFTCNGQIMAFGHPFFWQGETTMGANAADSIVVGGDDFFTFEVASIAEPIGMIDQDRFAGLRATTATLPTTIPINSSVTALNNGRSRDGSSSAVIPEIVPFLSWAHLYENILFTKPCRGPSLVRLPTAPLGICRDRTCTHPGGLSRPRRRASSRDNSSLCSATNSRRSSSRGSTSMPRSPMRKRSISWSGLRFLRTVSTLRTRPGSGRVPDR